jgi:hypothetical protein
MGASSNNHSRPEPSSPADAIATLTVKTQTSIALKTGCIGMVISECPYTELQFILHKYYLGVFEIYTYIPYKHSIKWACPTRTWTIVTQDGNFIKRKLLTFFAVFKNLPEVMVITNLAMTYVLSPHNLPHAHKVTLFQMLLVGLCYSSSSSFV